MDAEPRRDVAGRVLVSDRTPAVRIEVAAGFAHLGRLRFVLADVARVEAFVFAAGGDRGGRLLVVQFEGYLADNDHVYDYPLAEPVVLGGRPFLTDAAVVALEPPPRPTSDIGRVLDLVRARGYALPVRAAVRRFVHLPDAARRDELLINYAEGIGDEADAAPTAAAVLERALASFAVRFPNGSGAGAGTRA